MTTANDVTHLRRVDVLVALVCGAVSLVLLLGSVAYVGRTDGVMVSAAGLAVAAVVAVLQSLVLLARRAGPVHCFVLVSALQVLSAAVLPVPVQVQAVAALIAAYTVGLMVPLRRAVMVVVAVALLATVVVSLVGWFSGSAGSVGPTTTALRAVEYGGASLVNHLLLVLVGAFVGTRRAYTQMVTARAQERVSQERARADRAVVDERSRMARELHDIAAHHLSGMVVQAAAVERLIEVDPMQAREVTRALRAQGRQTLASLRIAVGILREGTDATGDGAGGLDEHGGPVPGVAAVYGLVASTAPGEDVQQAVAGEPWELPPVADVTVYRVVQEALSNARQHAPGAPVVVGLDWGDTALVVEVTNTCVPVTGEQRPGPARQGLGLVGMRERTDLIGAGLRTGPTASGGWSVRLDLPRGGGTRPGERRP